MRRGEDDDDEGSLGGKKKRKKNAPTCIEGIKEEKKTQSYLVRAN